MANTSSFQIDNFLEHIKRSASKAMDTDWTSNETTSSSSYANTMATTAAATFNHSSPLKTTRTRSSCFDISSISGTFAAQIQSNTQKVSKYMQSISGGNKKETFGFLYLEKGGWTANIKIIQRQSGAQIEMGAHIGYFYIL